jgi:hypothetical protein
VAHYGVITRDPRLDCVLTFVDDREEADAADWGVGEVRRAGLDWDARCGPALSLAAAPRESCLLRRQIRIRTRPPCPTRQVGGFEAYLLADEDKEGAAAADTYRQVRHHRP